MANFASSVWFQAKTGHEDAFLKPVIKFDASQHPGRVSQQLIDAEYCDFQSNLVRKNENAIAWARRDLIKYLDTKRPMLAAISPELGVAALTAGPIIEK
jgi:hypothetical protein